MKTAYVFIGVLLCICLCQPAAVQAQLKSKKPIPDTLLRKHGPVQPVPAPIRRVTFGEAGGGGGEDDPPVECLGANAGSNKVICDGNGPVQIGSGATQNYNYTYSWSPATGLSATNVPNPTANPTQTTTYTLTVTPQINLLDNGSFEGLNTGFSSDFSYGTTLYSVGQYSIETSATNMYAWWCNTTPTDGSYMLIADGVTGSAQRVWYQTVNVNQNETYNFSGQFLNLFSTGGVNDPNIYIKINGVTIAGVYLSYDDCHWLDLNASWYSGSTTTATIEIFNYGTQSSSGNGNDFAIDNLAFVGSTCPMTTSSTTVTVSNKPSIVETGPFEICYVYDAVLTFSLSTTTTNLPLQWYKNYNSITGQTTPTFSRYISGYDANDNPQTLQYTVGNACGLSDPVTLVTKATSGNYPMFSGYTGQHLLVCSTYNYTFLDPAYSITYNIGSPGNLQSVTYPTHYDVALIDAPGVTSFPTSFPISIIVKEFGCETIVNRTVTLYNYPYNYTDLTALKKPPPAYEFGRSNGESSGSERSVSIYPNPARSMVTITAKEPFQRIRILSSTGQLRKSYSKAGKVAVMDISMLLPGIYFVNVISGKAVSTEKLIVVK